MNYYYCYISSAPSQVCVVHGSVCCVVFTFSGSGDDSLDGLANRVSRVCPLTPSLSPRKRTTSQSKTEPPLLRTNKRTIYIAGRPPWYNVTGTTFKEAFVIGEFKLCCQERKGSSPDGFFFNGSMKKIIKMSFKSFMKV